MGYKATRSQNILTLPKSFYQLIIFKSSMCIVFALFTITPQISNAEIITLPGITVVGTRGAKCRTLTSCGVAWNINNMIIDDTPLYESPTFEDDEGVNDQYRSEFCEKLLEEKPAFCGLTTPEFSFINVNIPSVPGFDPSWSGNGCGTGGFPNYILDHVLGYGYNDFYELDEPYQGISFLSACNAHDNCFGTGDSSFAQCNSEFYQNMNNACGGIARCETFASAYYAAVESDIGRNAFDDAQANWDCAEFSDLWTINECPMVYY